MAGTMAARSRPGAKAAVALRYDASLPAPMVVATAVGRAAERAVGIALDAGVPVVEDGALAASLLPLEAGELVPREYWEIVAKVLIFIRGLPGGDA